MPTFAKNGGWTQPLIFLIALWSIVEFVLVWEIMQNFLDADKKGQETFEAYFGEFN